MSLRATEDPDKLLHKQNPAYDLLPNPPKGGFWVYKSCVLRSGTTTVEAVKEFFDPPTPSLSRGLGRAFLLTFQIYPHQKVFLSKPSLSRQTQGLFLSFLTLFLI